MKYLIMCEGPNEKKIMDILLDEGKLRVTRDDLVGLAIYHARQIKKSAHVKAQLEIYGGDVEIWRIGDKQIDRLEIPKEFKNQIKCVKKFCTLPELEVLLIISQGLYKEYEKTKSQKHPKQFAKENIVYNKKKYSGETKFYEDFYGSDVSKLVAAIREYKQRNHSHDVDQKYLVELLKDNK